MIKLLTSPVDRLQAMDRALHCGYLAKRGRFNKEWKRRFFVLLCDRLLYGKDEKLKACEQIPLTK